MQCLMLWVNTLQEIKNILRQKIDNVNNFYKGREKTIEGFKDGIFPFHCDDEDSRFKDNDESNIRDRNGLIDYQKLNKLIDLEERDISDGLFRKYFRYKIQEVCLKNWTTQKTQKEIISKKTWLEAHWLILNTKSKACLKMRLKWTNKWNSKYCWKILEFNKQKQGGSLKILTPNQMFSILPISLAQLKAGSNSKKT